MSILIAGRPVLAGEPLYHTGIHAWGTVRGYDGGAALLDITQGSNTRTFYVQNGGYINGVRQVYWHEPLVLDMPQQNINALQRILNAVVKELR